MKKALHCAFASHKSHQTFGFESCKIVKRIIELESSSIDYRPILFIFLVSLAFMRRSWGQNSLFVGMPEPLNFEMAQRTPFQGLNVVTMNNTCHVEVSLSTQFIASGSQRLFKRNQETRLSIARENFSSLWNKATARWMARQNIQIRLETDKVCPSFWERKRETAVTKAYEAANVPGFAIRLSTENELDFFIFSHWYQV